MSTRELVFLVVLAAATAAIVYGMSLVNEPAAWIVGGVLGGLVGWLGLSE